MLVALVSSVAVTALTLDLNATGAVSTRIRPAPRSLWTCRSCPAQCQWEENCIGDDENIRDIFYVHKMGA